MSFGEFLAAITKPALRDVAVHWNNARGSNKMPSWSDIKPSAIAAYLPYVWAWRWDPATGALVGRLSGEQIINAHGGSLRRQTDTDFFRHRGGEAIVQRQRRVMTEPCLCLCSGPVFAHMGLRAIGERIVMPLAEDHSTADGIIGATIYGFDQPPPAGPYRQYETETVEFFPLR